MDFQLTMKSELAINVILISIMIPTDTSASPAQVDALLADGTKKDLISIM